MLNELRLNKVTCLSHSSLVKLMQNAVFLGFFFFFPKINSYEKETGSVILHTQKKKPTYHNYGVISALFLVLSGNCNLWVHILSLGSPIFLKKKWLKIILWAFEKLTHAIKLTRKGALRQTIRFIWPHHNSYYYLPHQSSCHHPLPHQSSYHVCISFIIIIIIIIKTHFIAPSIKKNDRKALYKGKIQR